MGGTIWNHRTSPPGSAASAGRYQVSACNALEQACALKIDDAVLDLRRLLYCGEWIASHVLHIYFLHAPDFLGLPDSIALARTDRAAIERGLALKKAGNAILDTIGGRPIHPVNVRVGGFHRAPTRTELAPLAEQLGAALEYAVATVDWVSSFTYPDIELDHDLLALRHESRYAIEDGEIVSSTGLRCPAEEFPRHVVEHQVPHSTALHAELDGRRYLTGPLARYSLNSSQLTGQAASSATAAGLDVQCRNPYRSIVVRAVEVVYAVEEACGSSTATSGLRHLSPPPHRNTPSDTASAKRREDCCITATNSIPTAPHGGYHHPAHLTEPGGHRTRPPHRRERTSHACRRRPDRGV